MLTAALAVEEHLRSNLHRCSSHGDDRAFGVKEFSGEKADVFAASNNAASPEQATWPSRAKELNMQVCRRGEVAGAETGNQCGSQRLVQHRGQESALNEPGRIQERLTGVKSDLDRPVLRTDRD